MKKIGLIGFGSWVKSAYLPALEYDGRAKIVAVTASTDKTKQLARQTLSEDVTIFDNYEELLNKATLDAVMIAVPDNVHQSALSAASKAKQRLLLFMSHQFHIYAVKFRL